jgi:DNA-binding NarL/FixJ family response regulator
VKPSRTVRVLVADDSSVFRDAAAEVVAATPGFELVGEAESGEGAVVSAERLHPDLVLLDLRMPGLGGLESARRIQAGPAPIRVVLVTAGGDEQVREESWPVVDKRSLSPATLSALWRAGAGER